MSATKIDYAKMFGEISDMVDTMAKCACVACNSCVCACSCRNIPEDMDDIEW